MPTKTLRRAASGRFARKYSDQDLLTLVRQIASPGISERAYDREREALGRADTPRAGWIAKRLKTPWPRVVEIALASQGADLAIGVRRQKRLRDDLGRPVIVHYLRLVASHLGVERMTVGDYDQGRQELVEADAAHFRYGGRLARLLPSGQTIVHAAGSWAKALSWAGLQPIAERKRPLYPAELALDDFVADFGRAPSRPALQRYQQARNLAIGGLPLSRDFVTWRQQQLTSGRASRHGAVPLSGRGQRLDLDPAKITPAPPGYAAYGVRGVTIERVKADLGRALDLTPGASLSQRRYQHLAATHGLVALQTIQSVGRDAGGLTWAEIRDQVIAERARGSRK